MPERKGLCPMSLKVKCIRCQEWHDEKEQALCMECENHFKDIEVKTNNWDIEPNENHHKCLHCGVYFDECQCHGGYDV